MKLALIPPFSRLDDMKHTNYQLCLAHLLGNPSLDGIAYAGAFLDAQERGDFIILDNGAYEGSLVKASTLTELANDLKPDELVIPDGYRNEALTQEMATQFYNTYRSKLNPDVALMFVAQGTEHSELVNSIDWGMKQDWIKTLALPKHLLETCQDKKARLDFAEYIRKHSDKEVHFLGASPLWTDEIRAARDSGIVRGMDTSMAHIYGFHYERWPSDKIIDSAQSRHFYFELKGDAMQNDIITSNVKGMIDCVNEL